MNVPANVAVPCISAPQLALVEPDFNSRGAQCRANAPSCLGILRGIAQEHHPLGLARRLRRLFLHRRPLDLVCAAGACPEAAWQAIQGLVAVRFCSKGWSMSGTSSVRPGSIAA